MTIPNKPLILDFDMRELKWKEYEAILSKFTADPNEPMASSRNVRKFLEEHSNWSIEELEEIQVKEFEEIGRQLGDAINKKNIPLTNSPS